MNRIFEKYNRMEFHPNKTVVLKTGNEETINLNGNPLNYETEIRYLGDIFTYNYKYDRIKDTLINRLITLPGFCLVGICDVVK